MLITKKVSEKNNFSLFCFLLFMNFAGKTYLDPSKIFFANWTTAVKLCSEGRVWLQGRVYPGKTRYSSAGLGDENRILNVQYIKVKRDLI